MTAKKNPLLSRSEALSLSWKNRHDYKGYDRTKGSSFNSWRAIITTGKGLIIGFPATWTDYSIFMNEVQGTWSQGKIVRRFNTSQPHSAQNSFWAEKGTENSGKLIQLTYGGQTKTLLEWSAELGLNYQGVRQRYFKGKELSDEEILFGKNRVVRKPSNTNKRTRLLRMLGAYKLRDKKKGQICDIDIDWLRKFVESGCSYCGDDNRVGIDRIDNSRGHTKDNVVPACYDCNCARGNNFTSEEMLIIGKAIKEIKQCRLAKKN
jgi:hypothetical protein